MSIDSPKNRRINAIKAGAKQGKEFLIDESDTDFAEGTTGSVRHAKVSTLDDNNPYSADLVVKDYHSTNRMKADPKVLAKIALENYSLLKDAGITHLPSTFRLLKSDPTKIVMTNFNAHGYTAASLEHENSETEGVKFETIDQLIPLLREMYEEEVRMARNRIIR